MTWARSECPPTSLVSASEFIAASVISELWFSAAIRKRDLLLRRSHEGVYRPPKIDAAQQNRIIRLGQYGGPVAEWCQGEVTTLLLP